MARESACAPIASTRTLRKTQIQAPPMRPSAAAEKTRSTRLRPSSRTSASRTMRVSLLVLRQVLNTTVVSVVCQARERLALPARHGPVRDRDLGPPAIGLRHQRQKL